uniref:Uncharacterized protein n=1 Tax=Oryza glumipatula TaxID=40148 RepID=A0A0E0BHI1_9ORYZ
MAGSSAYHPPTDAKTDEQLSFDVYCVAPLQHTSYRKEKKEIREERKKKRTEIGREGDWERSGPDPPNAATAHRHARSPLSYPKK